MAFNELSEQGVESWDERMAKSIDDRSTEIDAQLLGKGAPGPNDVYVCRDPAFGNGLMVDAHHYWIRTAVYEVGMGTAAAGADAGNQYDFLLSQTLTISHFDPIKGFRSFGPGAECLPAIGANVAIANRMLTPGQPLGRFLPPINYCMSFATNVVTASGGEWPNFQRYKSPYPLPIQRRL
jgi:hypothetical protein